MKEITHKHSYWATVPTGTYFSIILSGKKIEGRIQRENGSMFFCHNNANYYEGPFKPKNNLGYKFAIYVSFSLSVYIKTNSLKLFKREEIKTKIQYTDQHVLFLQLLFDGLSNKEIANELKISVKRTEEIKTNLLKKHQVKNSMQLIRIIFLTQDKNHRILRLNF